MKRKSIYEQPCRRCGIKFGEDDRTFAFQKGKRPICFDCEIKVMKKKDLADLVIFMKKRL